MRAASFLAVAVGAMALLAAGVVGRSTAFLSQQQMIQAAEQEQAMEEQATAATNSLGEVIELLQQMLRDLDTQGQEDTKLWEEYSKWSSDTEQERTAFVQAQESLVMSTEARLSSNRQRVQTLAAEIGQLTTDIGEEEKSLAELIEMRREEHEQFEASLADLTKTIRAVTHATEILEGHYSASGAQLMQIRQAVQTALTMYGVPKSGTAENVRALASFLQGGSDLSGGNPDFLNADGSQYENYEHQGGARGVIGMLEDLRTQLEQQRQSLVATENDAQRQYESAKATKEADLARLKEEKSTKEGEKTAAEAQIEQDVVTIDQAQREIAEANQYLADLRADRERFQKSFQERAATRSDEQAATQAALDALQSVSIGAKQSTGAAAFLQLGSRQRRAHGASPVLSRLVDLGREIQSPALVQLASQTQQDYMSTSQQSFYDQGSMGPVVKLLSDLISRLEQEANAEATQHDWCETEKETSETSKEDREATIHTLKASIESLTTTIATLKSEVEFMESEIARVRAETDAATKQRQEEHELFVQSKADHEEVVAAIRQALSALGGQFSFVQVSMRGGLEQQQLQQQQMQQPAPGGSGALFADQAGAGGGAASAMEMLQDLLQRYEKALQELIADEEAAVKAHEELVRTNEQFITDTTATVNAKVAERRSKLGLLGDGKHEIKTDLIELHEIGKYLMDLRPSCDDIRSTFEERKKRREAEIAALREALTVLSDPSSQG